MLEVHKGDIYQSVINDVITQMREAFLDENVDIDVLAQLKKEWEEKVKQSGCIEAEPKPPAAALRSSAGVTQRAQPHMPTQRVQIQPSTQQEHSARLVAHRTQMHMTQQSQMQGVHGIPIQMQQVPMGGQYIQMPQRIPTYPSASIHMPQHLGGLTTQNIVVLSNGQQLQMPPGLQLAAGQRVVVQSTPAVGLQQMQASDVHQVDGNGGFHLSEDESSEVPGSSSSLSKKPRREQKATHARNNTVTRKEAEAMARKLCAVLQIDGGGMSDSSSEEEEEEEEDDPMHRLVDRIEEGEEKDGETEEEPLNSEDDQSDDEDLTTLFDADNVVMCQFEKVSRARSKWKFSLKDGIMHINNKDFAFSKCTGEAEW